MSAQLSMTIPETPPEIPEHLHWSERNARRRLYDLYRSRVGEWIPLRPDIVAVTRTKATARNSDLREHVLRGTGWVIKNRMRQTRDEHGEPLIMSYYRLVKREVDS